MQVEMGMEVGVWAWGGIGMEVKGLGRRKR